MAARTVAEVIAGEAVSGSDEQRMADMKAIASVIANRAQMLGITPQEVVANSNEFNAYNRSLPPGVGQSIIDMAQQAIDDVAVTGPVNNATFYATPSAVGNLPGGLSFEDQTSGHQYFSDPQNRAIGSALGYIQPDQFGYAQSLDDVPTPFAPNDLASNSLLSAFAPTAVDEMQAQSPTWGEINGVGPVYTPTFNQWAPMAAAPPVQAPMGSVTATGDLGGVPGLEASSTVGGLTSTPSSRMGIAEPSFDMSRFDGASPTVVGNFDPGRFGDALPSLADAARMDPLTGAVDPMTNTASFMDQQPADLGNMPDAYAAQRMPSMSVPLSMNAQAAMPDVPTASSLLSPTSLVTATPSLSTNLPTGVLPGQPVQQTGFVSNFPTAVTSNTIEPATINDVAAAPTLDDMQASQVQAPALETTTVVDQPTIAGPANPTIEDPQTAQITAPSTTTTATRSHPKGLLAGLLSKEAIGGGLLGGLALGPAGGLLGALAGQQVARNGGLGSMFGSSPMSINNIGGGIANTGAVWGGGMAPGTQATTSNGGFVTQMPSGLVAVTGPSGVTTGFDSTGKGYSMWGGTPGNDTEAEAESSSNGGGFFGGIFG